MATLYLAHDPNFTRNVAIKVLPQQFTHDPQFLARFRQEARVIASLEHPAIVPVYDFGEENGQPFLVMRYMVGGNLQERIQTIERFLPKEAVRILQQIAPGLDRAHQRGIIHRDIKPANILFDEAGNAHISDFGIAKMAEATAHLTGSAIIGTPAYMSPEQITGDKKIDGRSDVYALAIMLFQMLSGDLPYKADTPTKQLMKHVLEPVPSISAVNKDISPAVEQVLRKAMAKDPADRYATASDFVSALDRAASDAPVNSAAQGPTTIFDDISLETMLEDDWESSSAVSLKNRGPAEAKPERPDPTPERKSAAGSARPDSPTQKFSRGQLLGGAGLVIALLAALFLYSSGFFGGGGSSNGTEELDLSGSGAGGTAEVVAAAPTVTPTPTASPTATQTPSPTFTPTATPTETPTPEPTLTPAPLVLILPEVFGIEWVEIPAGPFWMGASELDEQAAEREFPLHQVELGRFWISKTEITNAQYQAFIEANPDYPVPNIADDWADSFNWDPESRSYPEGSGDLPVILVNWFDALAYANWLSGEIGLNVTLPSEAEWEKAARGPETPLIYPWGDEFDPLKGNFTGGADGFNNPSPVGIFPEGASPYGVLDMAGNVWEWTRSLWGTINDVQEYPYPYDPDDGRENLEAPPEMRRVLRGGAWRNDGNRVRTSERGNDNPNLRGRYGFRVVVRP